MFAAILGVTGICNHCADAHQHETAAEKEEVYYVFDVRTTDDIGLLNKNNTFGSL